jgi:hypothetical protein
MAEYGAWTSVRSTRLSGPKVFPSLEAVSVPQPPKLKNVNELMTNDIFFVVFMCLPMRAAKAFAKCRDPDAKSTHPLTWTSCGCKVLACCSRKHTTSEEVRILLNRGYKHPIVALSSHALKESRQRWIDDTAVRVMVSDRCYRSQSKFPSILVTDEVSICIAWICIGQIHKAR